MRPVVRSILTMIVAGPFATITPPATVAAAPPRAAMPWVEINRREIVRAGRPGMVRTIAARLGAAMAWDLADLPRHQIGATQPWGVFRSRPDFAATTLPLPPGDGGAIGACITRWNTLYPPYALTAMDDVDRPVRRENDPSEEPSCPGN
jgi:hypothetical protein